MTARVLFEDEAQAEYLLAGRWYEARRERLGFEFFDAVDAAIRQIVAQPNSGALVPRISTDLQARRVPVTRFPYHVVYLTTKTHIRISPLLTTVDGQGIGRAGWGRPKQTGCI